MHRFQSCVIRSQIFNNGRKRVPELKFTQKRGPRKNEVKVFMARCGHRTDIEVMRTVERFKHINRKISKTERRAVAELDHTAGVRLNKLCNRFHLVVDVMIFSKLQAVGHIEPQPPGTGVSHVPKKHEVFRKSPTKQRVHSDMKSVAIFC